MKIFYIEYELRSLIMIKTMIVPINDRLQYQKLQWWRHDPSTKWISPWFKSHLSLTKEPNYLTRKLHIPKEV